MPAYARSQIVPPDEVGVYHCIARCVRRAFLCGFDPLTKHDYDHRKEWIRERLEHPTKDTCRSSSTSTCRFWTGPADSFVRRVKGRSRPSSRRFWSAWESSAMAGWRQCGISADGS